MSLELSFKRYHLIIIKLFAKIVLFVNVISIFKGRNKSWFLEYTNSCKMNSFEFHCLFFVHIMKLISKWSMNNTDIIFLDLNSKIMLFLRLECKIYRIELYENGYLSYSMLKNTKSSWDDIIDSLCCEFERFVLIVLFSLVRTAGESDRVLERIREQSLLGREESSGGNSWKKR